MEELLSSIRKSLESRNFYSALFLAITMPSICGALESSDGKDTSQKYADWYDKYMPKSFLSGSDCYGFRCKLLHVGTGAVGDDPNKPIRRVMFTFLPGMSGNRADDAVQFDGIEFCQSMINAVEKWLEEVKDNPEFLKNSKNLIALHPNGIRPYIVGIPVVG